jgi:hypothetical protein
LLSGRGELGFTIEHDHTSDECLSETCGQSDEAIVREATSDNLVLVVPLRPVRRVDICPLSFGVEKVLWRAVARALAYQLVRYRPDEKLTDIY